MKVGLIVAGLLASGCAPEADVEGVEVPPAEVD